MAMVTPIVLRQAVDLQVLERERGALCGRLADSYLAPDYPDSKTCGAQNGLQLLEVPEECEQQHAGEQLLKRGTRGPTPIGLGAGEGAEVCPMSEHEGQQAQDQPAIDPGTGALSKPMQAEAVLARPTRQGRREAPSRGARGSHASAG